MTEIRRTAQDEFSDLVVVERRQPVPRSLEGMHGVYTLDGWRDANGESREFACEIVKISPHAIKLLAPVTGSVGMHMTVEFENLGTFHGPIIQILPRGLVMKVVGTHEEER